MTCFLHPKALFMYTPIMDLNVEELNTLIIEKRKVYNEMLTENKEFEEVKAIFIEIKILEESLEKSLPKIF